MSVAGAKRPGPAQREPGRNGHPGKAADLRPIVAPDKMPPHNPAAERAILGALLVEPESMRGIRAILDAAEPVGAAFFDEDCRAVYRAAVALDDEGHAVGMAGVADKLEAGGWPLDRTLDLLAELRDTVGTAGDAGHNANIVLQKWAMRAAVEAADRARARAYSGLYSADDVIADQESELARIRKASGATMRRATGWEAAIVEDVATWLERDIELAYDVEDVLVRGQPAVVGAQRKSLKTTVSLDLAVSLATQTPFLGRFAVPDRRRVLLLSIESGDATIHETIKRICSNRGATPESGWLLPGFKAPLFADPAQTRRFGEFLAERRIDTVIVDPLYLCLSDPTGKLNTADVFSMGSAIKSIIDVCQSAGATPIFNHHFVRQRGALATIDEPPDLEQLSHAGVVEIARQWILLARRERYVPGTGEHRLWMATGGSAGHQGLWGLNIDEPGRFRQRTYHAEVIPAAEVIDMEAAGKAAEARARQQERDEQTRTQSEVDADAAIELLTQTLGGAATRNNWEQAFPPGKARFNRAFGLLQRSGRIQPAQVTVPCGLSGSRTVSGWSPAGYA